MRTRSCTNPAPGERGADCVGKPTENRSCNNHACPGESCIYQALYLNFIIYIMNYHHVC